MSFDLYDICRKSKYMTGFYLQMLFFVVKYDVEVVYIVVFVFVECCFSEKNHDFLYKDDKKSVKV